MKIATFGLALTLWWTAPAFAQTDTKLGGSKPVETKSSEISSVLVDPFPQDPQRELPDAPISVLPSRQDGPMPCPAGVGLSCALLGGRLYFSDPSHMTEHNATWGQAMRNPLVMTASILRLASMVADIEETQNCIRAHTCKEGNPIFGPSRARQYGIGVPLELSVISLAGWLKKRGDGNLAFGILWGGTILHATLAAHAAAVASRPSTQHMSASNQRQNLITIRF